MTEEENEINHLNNCIGLIEQYHSPQFLSAAITLAASLMLLYQALVNTITVSWFFALALIIILGLLETVYAIRIGFDLALLRRLAKQPSGIESGLASIDGTLVKLQLIAENKTGRSLDARLTGCLRLFKTQLALCVLQIISVLCVAAIQLLFVSIKEV